MSAPEEAGEIRRILIAIDTSPHSLAALQAAVELAARVNAELSGLFVEDVNLLRIAELNFAREVSHYSATVNQFSREGLEQQLRAQETYARREITNTGRRANVRVTFQIIRGVIHTEVLRAANEVDLVVLGRSGWSRRRQLGSTARLVVTQSTRHALILQHGTRLLAPFGVVYDGSDPSRRSLALLAHLMGGEDTTLQVLILSRSIEQAHSLQKEVNQWLNDHHLEARFRWLTYPNAARLISLVREMKMKTLVLPAEVASLTGDEIGEILDELQIPVLLVR